MTIKTPYLTLLTLCFTVLLSCNSSTKTTPIHQTSVNSSTNTSAGTYTSKMTKSDKKKYYTSDGQVAYEIKYKADGFKLRTAASTLLWKVKLYNTKVKISDNEENLNPYEIKITDTYAAKLVKDDTVLARTGYDLELKQQSVTATTASQPDFIETSYSPSLLLQTISEISDDQKQILIQELQSKGY